MLNQTSYHGAGAIAEIVNEAKAHDYKKAFVCSDPDLIKFQVSTKVTDLLDQAGFPTRFIPTSRQNPRLRTLRTGVAAFKNPSGLYYCNRRRIFYGCGKKRSRHYHRKSGI